MFQRIIDKLLYEYRKRQKPVHTFISAIDLMQPINGEKKAFQLNTIARMLDIERIRQGDKSWWDYRIGNCLRPMLESDKKKFNEQFEKIIESLDKYGWDYKLSEVQINRKPLFTYNGTHRVAYSLLKNPFQVVPVCINNDGWLWANENGPAFFSQIGLTQGEIQTLVERYDKLIQEFSYNYKIFVPANTEVSSLISSLKEAEGENEINVKRYCVEYYDPESFFSSTDKRFFKKNSNGFLMISFNKRNKDLCYDKDEFRSEVLESIINRCKILDYTYTPTITKSIEMEIWLKGNCNVIEEQL